MKTRILNCVIDNRVSTDRQLFGSGLDSQEKTCDFFANKNNWNTLEVFSKSYSGRKEVREDFKIILAQIDAYQSNGTKVDYYLIKSIDRFTRLGSIVYDEMNEELAKRGVQLVDTRNTIQPLINTLEHLGETYSWSIKKPSRKAEILEAESAKDEATEILTRMISAEISLVRDGFSMRKPNDGYKNARAIINGQDLSVTRQNDNRAYFYKEIYELRGSGSYSDQEIVNRVNALGYKSIPQKIWQKNGKTKIVIGWTTPREMTVKQLQKLIKRTMYAGVKYEKWNKIEGAVWAVFAEDSEPIVTVDQFNKANRGSVFIRVNQSGNPEVLYDYTEKDPNIKSRRKYHPEYAYDKMVACTVCYKPLKNSGRGNKGKLGTYYQGYHCDRTKECKKVTGRIPKDIYDKKISALLERIKFSDDFSNKLEERLLKKYREREQEVLGKSITMSENVVGLKKRQQSLMADFSATTSPVVKRMLGEQIDDLEVKILQGQSERNKVEIQERDVKSFVRYATEIVEHPLKKLADNKNPLFQRALFSLVFDEPLTYTQVVNGTPKLSFIFKLSDTQTCTKSSMVTQPDTEIEQKYSETLLLSLNTSSQCWQNDLISPPTVCQKQGPEGRRFFVDWKPAWQSQCKICYILC